MINACVIGYPLGYSLSPSIHRYWFERHGIEGDYQALPVEPGLFQSTVVRLADEGYAGFNVTIPYKQDILKRCASLHPAARAIGAVNTVRIEADGSLSGFNTDAFGFMENLRRQAAEFAPSPALVLGAGGAARAVVYALRDAGVKEIAITNRTGDRAGELAAAFGGTAVAWEHREAALEGCGLLVNTTALGMTGKPGLAISLAALPRGAIVCDIVYAPLMTPLLLEAQARGNRIVTGLGMLVHQARPAFEAWTGILPDVDPDLERMLAGRAA